MLAKKLYAKTLHSTQLLKSSSLLGCKYFRRNLLPGSFPCCGQLEINCVGRFQRRYCSTQLSKVFNAPSSIFPELQLLKKYAGLLQFEELSNPNGFDVLQEKVKKKVDELMEECASKNRSRKMVEVFDDLSNTLCKLADMAEFIRLAHPSEEYRNAACNVSTSIISLVERLNTNKEIYDALIHVLKVGDIIPMSETDKHVSELFIFDFEQSGIHLSEDERIRVNELNDAIVLSGHEFVKGTQKHRLVAANLVPMFIRRHFQSDLYHVMVCDLQPQNELEAVREMAHRIYLHTDEMQEKTLKTMLKSRHELATLCGFPSYAHRATRGSLGETPEFIDEFLVKLALRLKPYIEEERELMLTIKNELHWTSPDVQPWDLTYLTVASRNQKLDRDFSDGLHKYFSLGAVMEGINNVFMSIFGVHLRPETSQRSEVWSYDVIKLAVVDSNEEVLGHIYCDFFKREHKTTQECHFTIRGGKQLADGSYQNPVVVLHLDITKDTDGTTTLNIPQVENLFHEMGHAIHSMLARTKYQHITGTRCCTDFAEVPSILMEFFLHDPRVMQTVSSHYETKKPLTIHQAEEVIDARNLFNAMDLSLQTFYSALDQRLHGVNDWDTESTIEILKDTQEKFYFLPYIEDTAWHHRFGHLVGYGAKYYSYLMSRAVASWIWQQNFQDDPFDREMGQKLREQVLCHGGGKPPKAMVSDYLGKEITADGLVDALLNDLEMRKKSMYNFPVVIL